MRPTAVLLVALIPLLLVLITPTAVDAARPAKDGKWTPIEDMYDPYVLQITAFALIDHYKTSGEMLSFIRGVRGETEAVDGTNYRLILETKSDANVVVNYEAVVWDKPEEKQRKLTSFKPVKA